MPGYMLRFDSCAVWKLASEDELATEGAEDLCSGIVNQGGLLLAVSTFVGDAARSASRRAL